MLVIGTITLEFDERRTFILLCEGRTLDWIEKIRVTTAKTACV